MEASGTGNMKLALNGAVTIGTLDGANIEIREKVGAENIFEFGLTVEEIEVLDRQGYDPRRIYEGEPELKRVIDLIASGSLAPKEPGVFDPLVKSLLEQGDRFKVLADWDAYVRAQGKASAAFAKPGEWARMSILNCAHVGRFSSDRTIREYASEIWGVGPVPVPPGPSTA
jgi:starch phosphorylase